jgi:hypothetical protein
MRCSASVPWTSGACRRSLPGSLSRSTPVCEPRRAESPELGRFGGSGQTRGPWGSKSDGSNSAARPAISEHARRLSSPRKINPAEPPRSCSRRRFETQGGPVSSSSPGNRSCWPRGTSTWPFANLLDAARRKRNSSATMWRGSPSQPSWLEDLARHRRLRRRRSHPPSCAIAEGPEAAAKHDDADRRQLGLPVAAE